MKTLMEGDIPTHYSYAAVDKDGFAYAYKKRPVLISSLHWSRSTHDDSIPHPLGGGFDASDWLNSLVYYTESIKMQKLTENDIPEGYKFAAVDEDGIAYAFKTIPELNRNDACWYPTDEENSLLRVGEDFDATNWTTSLVAKKTLKKLTIDDIPEGYSWAAVDSDGFAYAHETKPIITANGEWKSRFRIFISSGFDGSNWEHSLIMRKELEEYQEGFEEEKKDSMEPVFLENCTFNFTQEANCKADTDDDEELEIKYTSDLGLDRTGGGFFVLKTEGWAINDEQDIKRLLDRIRLLISVHNNK
jgi:hypothetical protein